MKKVIMMLAMLTMTLAASAQFEKGNTYIGATLSGLNMSYNGKSGFNFGVSAMGGAFIANNWLIYGELGYDHKGKMEGVDYAMNDVTLGGGGRYYFQNCGVLIGAHIDYVHGTKNYNDCMPGIEIGYCFFISGELALEPSIYYNQSITRHSDYSTVGLKVTLSLFHQKKQLVDAVKTALQ